MPRTLRIAVTALAISPLILATLACQGDPAGNPPATDRPAQQDFRLRSDVEAALPALAEAFQSNPNDDATRRAYADILYKLGNIWEADEVISPLGQPPRQTSPTCSSPPEWPTCSATTSAPNPSSTA